MYVILVDFQVQREFADDFRKLVLQQAANSLAWETGCRRFDVAFGEGDATSCLLYELYDDQASFDAHLATRHFKRFSNEIQEYVVRKTVTFWEYCELPSSE